MLRLLPARYYEAATTGTRRQIQPRSSSDSLYVAEAEEDLALLSVGMCLALCTAPPRVYETAGRNLIICQLHSRHDELRVLRDAGIPS